MISKELFDAVADLYAPGNRDALKRQVYYDINRTLKNTKKGKKYVEVYNATPSVLIEVNKELLEAGYFSMVSENAENGVFLRLYLRDL